MDKNLSPNYSSSQITYSEAVEFSRFRFHRKRTASSFRFHMLQESFAWTLNSCIQNQLYGKANKPDESNSNDKRCQPMETGCQPVAKAIETGKLSAKDNNLKSPQRNHSEISTESTWRLPKGQSRQEMHVTGNASLEHELKFRR